jgi:hypothetical protein
MSRRRSYQRTIRHLSKMCAGLALHPVRVAIIGLTTITLFWLILTKSLSYVVAETSPEFALWLYPNHPVALLTLADSARNQLLELSRPDASTTSEEKAAIAATPPSNENLEKRKSLRDEIRSLAMRAIANDSLNARAFRLLAEVTDDPEQIRALMQEAVKRSRRESTAVFWLMNDSFERKDLAGVVEKADILLRTRPQLAPYVMNYLGNVAGDEEGRTLLVSLLAQNPPWRGAFLSALPRNTQFTDAPLELMLALKDTGNPPTDAELAPYLTILLSKDLAGLAYSAWLQFRTPEKLASLKFLNNPGFADDPSGLPFDWQIARGINVGLDFVRLSASDADRAVRFSFGNGRVKFPQMSQILMLSPGRYRFTGSFQGGIVAKRGLRWQFRCMGGKKTSLAETDMIYGRVGALQEFTLDVDIPSNDDCQAQQVRLYHDARSASEELITGEISLHALNLTRN